MNESALEQAAPASETDPRLRVAFGKCFPS